MILLKRLLPVSITWLTAAATLFAGLPQVVCFCGSTATATVVSDSLPKNSRCCCGLHDSCDDVGGCCRQPTPKATTADCCSQAKTEDGPVLRISQTPCSRGLVGSTQSTIVSTPTNFKFSTALAATIGSAPVLVPAPTLLTAQSTPARAPAHPVDLICLLQHLLI
jgi:hypothetical protein